jgi:hypothetical protein
MNRLAGAFESLKQAQARACGKPQRVRIGRKYYDAIVGTIALSDAFLSGGVGQSGSYVVSVAVAEFGPREPKKFTPVMVEGSDKELSVLDVNTVNGVTYEITAGDAANEGR